MKKNKIILTIIYGFLIYSVAVIIGIYFIALLTMNYYNMFIIRNVLSVITCALILILFFGAVITQIWEEKKKKRGDK